MKIEYPKNCNIFTFEEIGYLLTALGFPKDLLKKNLSDKFFQKDDLPVKTLLHFCKIRYFVKDLHYTINLKSGSYNNTVLQKGIYFLLNKCGSFEDLRNIRLAFEAFEDYDQKGMTINERTFLRTIKMCGRVIAPKKLINKLRHIKDSFKEKGRIQLYEFLDLLVSCELLANQNTKDDCSSSIDKTWREIYFVDNFRNFVIPKDKKMWNILNEQYKNEELHYETPTLKSKKFYEKPLMSDEFRTQAKVSSKDYMMTLKKLRESNKQIKLSKGGFTQVRPQAKASCRSASTSRTKNKSDISVAEQLSYTEGVKLYHAPSTTIAIPTQRSLPINSEVVNKVRKQRAISCPPVVEKSSKDRLTIELNRLKFDIHTKDQRWEKSYTKEILKVLPNYKEVLERTSKQRTSPGKNKVKYIRPQPSAGVMTRLSQPKPVMSHKHPSHCTAINKGIGMDLHAVKRQTHAKEVIHHVKVVLPRKKKKRRLKLDMQGWAAFNKKPKSLFHHLLLGIDKADYDVTNCNDDIIVTEQGFENENFNFEVEEMHKQSTENCEILVNECEDIVVGDDATNMTQTYVFQPYNRADENFKLMNQQFERIYLKHEEKKMSKKDDSNSNNRKKCPSRPPSGRSIKSQTTEITEFEKFIMNEDNLKKVLKEICL